MLWIWLIARKRKNWAQWISVALLVAALPHMILDADIKFQASPAAAVAFYVVYLIWAVAISLLFAPDARGWFRQKPLPIGAGK